MSLAGGAPGDADTGVRDRAEHRTVVSSRRPWSGAKWSMRTDEVELSSGECVTRDVVDHPGAVGIVALDAEDRVLLLQQYRHPVAALLWEPPAGLLDVEGEHPLEAARRELGEEAGLRAARWDVLVDYFTSPGSSSEALRCYLARDLTEVPAGERHEGEHEEADMPARWVPLEEAVGLVLAGALHNPTAVVGILAAATARSRGWAGLRPADAPWPERFPTPSPPTPSR